MYSEYNADLANKHLDFLNKNPIAKSLINKAIDKSFEFKGYTLQDYMNMLTQCEYSVDTTEVNIVYSSAQHIASKLTYMRSSKVCVLNFADYLKPGGLFLNGSMAQEESLCHSSGLYPILKFFEDDYNERKGTSNKGAYQETGIYTEDCPFYVGGKQTLCDVLTYAAVNYRVIERCGGTDTERNFLAETMRNRQRIAYILPKIFGGCDEVILGAWGCGVFKNDVREVARTWAECTKEFNGLYRKIYHPVLSSVTCSRIFDEAYDGECNLMEG